MTLKSSGTQLSFSEIGNEFGLPPNSGGTGNSFGGYRVLETVGQLSLPLDTNIPQAGEIRFSQFYGKKLNIVVDLHSGTTEFRQDARSDKYNNNNVRVIGGFRNAPSDSGEAPTGGVRGKRVYIHVNKTLGSEINSNTQICALRTGSWESNTELSVDIGSSGKIIGAGGAGGKGKSKDFGGSATDGGDGNSALGVQYNNTEVNIVSGGLISCGYGGGGGGGTASNKDR